MAYAAREEPTAQSSRKSGPQSVRVGLARDNRSNGSGNELRPEDLGFEVVRMFVAELAHRFFVSDHPIARSDRPMTRLPDRTCTRTFWGIVVNIERCDESSLAIRAGVH